MSAKKSKLHYRPSTGYFGDPIPFYWDEQYHLFYLEGQFDSYRRVRFTPFNHLVSRDLINWEELPVAIPLGSSDDIDMSLGTGSIIAHDGRFYFLYCGRKLIYGKDRKNYETTCLATSNDLIHWKKHPNNPILIPDGSVYATDNFRDPFPFWNAEENCYWMVIASKLANKETLRSGCLALAVSQDLEHWELRQPFYSPNTHSGALECPDLFEEQGKWYVIYSTDGRTSYRVADRLTGPWLSPKPDNSDCYFPGLYAAKTLYNSKRRFLFGWLGTKEKESDTGRIEWGGDMMIPRELVPLPEGRLAEICPREILEACGPEVEVHLDFRLGKWQQASSFLNGRRLDGLAYAVVCATSSDLLVEFSMKFAPETNAGGIIFRANPSLTTFYALRLEPDSHHVVIEKGFSILAERRLDTVPGKSVMVQLFLDNDIIEAFVDGCSVMCCRGYDFLKSGELGIFVQNGEATFENLKVRLLPH